MGNPNETVTQNFQDFDARYAGWRDELAPRLKPLFYELRGMATMLTTSINRQAPADVERPIFLAMLLKVYEIVVSNRRRIAKLEATVRALTRELEMTNGINVPALRGIRPIGIELDLVGQERIENYSPEGPLSTELPGGESVPAA